MNLDITLSRVGLFDVEPTRQSVTKRLLKNFRVGDECYYLDDGGLRIAGAFSYAKHTFSKIEAHDSRIPRESGFDIHAKNIPATAYSNLLITKHSLERWSQRAGANFPTANKLSELDSTLACKAIYECLSLNKDFGTIELFYPFGEGAFIIELSQTTHNEMTEFLNSVALAKRTCGFANWTYNKTKKRWVGEFIPRGGVAVIKTYLGWEELKRGGTFNAMDWYKQNMDWAEFDAKYKQKLIDLGIEL